MTDQGRSTEVVRIDALVCGPGFQELLMEPRVIAIAERIASGRVVATPIVRAGDMNVIAGEDVVAAFCVLDNAEVLVELVHDGSFDDELPTELSPDSETRYGLGVASAAAERTEVTPVPAWRDLDAADVLADLHAQLDGQVDTAERVQAVQARGVTQKAAVAAVAVETGKSEHAVKKAANRAKRAKDKVAIETWGREQPEAWMAATAELRRTMTNASNAIRTAMSALSPLVGSAVAPGCDFPAIYGELKDRAANLRSMRPACVCAWCKNEPGLVVRCVACGGRGWLGEQAMSLVPKELAPPWSAMSGGRAVTLPELMADVTAVDAAAKKAANDVLDELQEVEGGRPLGMDAGPAMPARVDPSSFKALESGLREFVNEVLAEPEMRADDDDGDMW